MNEILTYQWFFLLAFGLVFLWLSPRAKSLSQFFSAESTSGNKPNVFMLTSSLVISWIFAKSITNAANLGMSFGIVGGISYAVYYFSFFIAGFVIYQLRTQGGFKSIHDFIFTNFGQKAVVVFSVLIGFRLFNEIWSNTMVIGSYFGELGSLQYYMSIVAFTLLTLLYTIKGGLRSSLITDAIQMLFFGVLLFIILGIMMPKGKEDILDYAMSGEWTMSMGLNLFFVALLQIFSYPFHDPVLTDRGFISDAKVTLKSYLCAGAIGFVCLTLFSLVGVFAQFQGLSGQAPVEVGRLLGTVTMLGMNFIMITSAASTLDSAFSSFSKLVVIDLKMTKVVDIKSGRIVMAIIAVAGSLPIFFSPEILSATTISGTMVMGLAPVFLFWKCKTNQLSFMLPVGFGMGIGVFFALGWIPEFVMFTDGKYADLLSANLIGFVGCFIMFFLSLRLSDYKV